MSRVGATKSSSFARHYKRWTISTDSGAELCDIFATVVKGYSPIVALLREGSLRVGTYLQTSDLSNFYYILLFKLNIWIIASILGRSDEN